jgi:hypothetical protein
MDITIDNYYYSYIIPRGININNYDIAILMVLLVMVPTLL